MDGFIFTFVPVVFKLGLGFGLPLLGLYKLAPALWQKRIESLRVRHHQAELEEYVDRANAVVCDLIVKGVITESSREVLYQLQADYSNRNRKSLTR